MAGTLPSTRESDRRRFDAMVNKDGYLAPGMDTSCREWTGAVDARGYPKFWLRGNSVTAQRAALLLAGASLAPHLVVASACGNRLCVRREHLVVATVPEAHGMRSRGDIAGRPRRAVPHQEGRQGRRGDGRAGGPVVRPQEGAGRADSGTRYGTHGGVGPPPRGHGRHAQGHRGAWRHVVSDMVSCGH